MDAILVLMQVGREGDWTDRGLPEVVTGYKTGSPTAAGAEWMFDHHSTVWDDSWRLLIWTNVRDGSWDHDHPDAVLTPALYRAAVAERGLTPTRIRRPKVNPVIAKIRAAEVKLGDRVLVTQNRVNSSVSSPGDAWHLADYPDRTCVAVRVNGRGDTLSQGKTTEICLRTSVGEIVGIPPSAAVIPVADEPQD
jgi:hypothetical protein